MHKGVLAQGMLREGSYGANNSLHHTFFDRLAISPLCGTLRGCREKKKKNTLQEDYAASMPSLLQEFVMLHLVCKCGGKEKETECYCVCVRGLPEFTPLL